METGARGFCPAALLPPRFPDLREAGAGDLPRICGWLRCGRAEGAFRRGTEPTIASLREYHRSFLAGDWQYRCLIIEADGRPAGYVDFRWRGREGEVLGIYLEPQRRGAQLGSHVLASVVERLRTAGCRQARVEIYADNAASRAAFTRAGFCAAPSRGRMEDGHQVEVWRHRLRPMQRLQPANPRYRELTGRNIFEHHVAAAQVLSQSLASVPGVGVILGLGSLARGFADEFSDVDLMVIGRGPEVAGLPAGEHFAAGTSVDVFAIDLDQAPVDRWNTERREAVLESVVLYRAAGFSLPSLVQRCRLSSRERKTRVAECFLKLGWVGLHPPAWDGKTRYGYCWNLPPDVWRQRGDCDSAQQTVDHGLDLALQALYLINDQHVPYPKWRVFLATGMEWQPAGFRERLALLLRAARNRSALRSRINVLLGLVDDLARQAERRGLLRGDIYRSWREQSDDYATTR